MVQTNVANNLIPNELDLKGLLDLFKKEILLGFNCHHVGTIQSFDSVKQLAQVTINYTKTFFEPDASGVYSPKQVNYPILIDSPVICIGGGGGSLTFPIAKGDECLVLFNDRDIDNWFNGSSNSAVATGRLHSFSDAIILVGVRSLANVITAYNANATELRNKAGNVKVSITNTEVTLAHGANTLVLNSDKLLITLGSSGTSFELNTSGKLKINNVTSEFVAALMSLFADIQSGTILGLPLVMPTFAADLAKLGSFS